MIWHLFETDFRVALQALEMEVSIAHDHESSSIISISVIDPGNDLESLDGSIKHLGVFSGHTLFEVSLEGFDTEVVSSGKSAAAVCYA